MRTFPFGLMFRCVSFLRTPILRSHLNCLGRWASAAHHAVPIGPPRLRTSSLGAQMICCATVVQRDPILSWMNGSWASQLRGNPLSVSFHQPVRLSECFVPLLVLDVLSERRDIFDNRGVKIDLYRSMRHKKQWNAEPPTHQTFD